MLLDVRVSAPRVQGVSLEQLSLHRFAVSDVVRALELVWRSEISRRHPSLPPIAVVVASGSEGWKTPKWGHFGAARWRVDDEIGEVLIAGECLNQGARTVLGVLLHEAAHALAHAHGDKDTSRQARYHNEKFREYAESVGLEVTKHERDGWNQTAVPDATAESYADAIGHLEVVLRGYRTTPDKASKPPKKQAVPLTCRCDPPRSIRIAAAVAALGPITCGICRGRFAAEGDADADEGGEE